MAKNRIHHMLAEI